MNEATGALNNNVGANTGTGKIEASVVLTVGWTDEAVSGASSMLAVSEISVVEPPSSATVMVTA